MTRPTPPRAFFVGMPPPIVRAAVGGIYVRHNLASTARVKLVSPENLHQSFSERIYNPTTQECEALLQIGASISAHASTLQFNRIRGDEGTHWTMHARGEPKSFILLKTIVRSALENAGFAHIATGVTPHMTLSYSGTAFIEIDIAPPIEWTIDELLLVVGGGDPYRYEVIGRWPLLPEIDPPASQLGLF